MNVARLPELLGQTVAERAVPRDGTRGGPPANGATVVMPNCDYALRCGHCGAGDHRRPVCRCLHRGAGCAQRSILNKEPAEARSGCRRRTFAGLAQRLRAGQPNGDQGAGSRVVTPAGAVPVFPAGAGSLDCPTRGSLGSSNGSTEGTVRRDVMMRAANFHATVQVASYRAG
jgi:hypothetical protein